MCDRKCDEWERVYKNPEKWGCRLWNFFKQGFTLFFYPSCILSLLGNNISLKDKYDVSKGFPMFFVPKWEQGNPTRPLVP